MVKPTRKTVLRASLLIVFMMLVSSSMIFIFGSGGGCPIEARLADMNVTTISTSVNGNRTVTAGNALVITGAGRVTGNITVNVGGLLVVQGNYSPVTSVIGRTPTSDRAIHGRVVLNGGDFYMISGGIWVPAASNTNPAVTINNGATFTMKDGVIRNPTNIPNASQATFAVDVINGHFVLEGGTVVGGGGGTSSRITVPGVRLDASGNGTFTMNGGVLLIPGGAPSTGAVMINGGAFYMNGGTIRGLRSSSVLVNGRGVCIRGGNNPATFIMTGGEMYGLARGVEVDGQNAVFTMYGGTIRNNGSTCSGSSGTTGVNTSAGATFTMHGGSITGNITSNNGAGVRVSGIGTTFTMYNGTISYNSAHTGSAGLRSITTRGGGVLVEYSGRFYMYGGYIENNSAGGGGGVAITSTNTFGNSAFTQHQSYMKLDGGTIRNNEATIGYKSLGGGGVGIYATTMNSSNTTLSSWATFDMYSGYITGNRASSRSGGAGGQSGAVGTFGVSGGGVSLTVASGSSGVARMNPHATFNIHGGTISGNYTSCSRSSSYVMGGAVYASVDGAVINMYGGVIEGNSSIAGGAVGLNTGAVFNMHDGIIRDNEARGVYMGRSWLTYWYWATHGGMQIRGGGAVYLHNGGRVVAGNSPRFNMYGGSMVENISPDGGGIFWMCLDLVEITNNNQTEALNAAANRRRREHTLSNIYISANAVVQNNIATRGTRVDDLLWGRHRVEDPTVDWGADVVTRNVPAPGGGEFRHLFNNHDIRTMHEFTEDPGPMPTPEPTPTPVPVYDVTFVNTPQGYLNGVHGANVYLQLDYNETVTADMVPNADGIHGWEFTGWSYDAAGNFPADPAGHVVTGDINFYAHFQRVYFRVTFVAGENGVIVGDEYIYVLFEDTLTYDMLPETEPDEHFVLSGWDPDPMHGVIVTGDMTIYASFVRLRITIRFEANPEYGGFLGQGQPYMMLSYLDGDVIVPPVATPQWGFEFVGWTPDPTGYIVTPSSHDSIFIAVFAPIGHGG